MSGSTANVDIYLSYSHLLTAHPATTTGQCLEGQRAKRRSPLCSPEGAALLGRELCHDLTQSPHFVGRRTTREAQSEHGSWPQTFPVPVCGPYFKQFKQTGRNRGWLWRTREPRGPLCDHQRRALNVLVIEIGRCSTISAHVYLLGLMDYCFFSHR